jgi:hypothetical protein
MHKIYLLFSRFRATILVWLTHTVALPLLKLVRQSERFPYTEADLAGLPPGSLGNDLLLFLRGKRLHLLPYYVRHDLKHILLRYDTTGEGEVCLQCFMLGNGHLSFPVLSTVLYGLVTMPEHYGLFRRAWRRGRACQPLERLHWTALLHLSTQSLIHAIDHHEKISA